MASTPNELLVEIAHAFDGVQRGAGTTWLEGEALDCHASPDELTAARLLDTDTRWHVPHEKFQQYPSPVFFLDPEGLRYYLPAIMTWSLITDRRTSSSTADNLLHLLNDKERRDNLVATLTPAQGRATAHWVFHETESWLNPNSDWLTQLRAFWNRYLANDPSVSDLTLAQIQELDNRLARLQDTGALGSPWSDVRGRLNPPTE